MAKAKAPEEKPPTADDAVEIETMWVDALEFIVGRNTS